MWGVSQRFSATQIGGCKIVRRYDAKDCHIVSLVTEGPLSMSSCAVPVVHILQAM